MKQKVALGIDVGGTNTALGMVDPEGNVLVCHSIPTPSHGDAGRYVSDLSEAVRALIDTVRNPKHNLEIKGIGIGAPIANYYKGTIENAPNLSFRGVVPFVSLLKNHFPEMEVIVMTNDANAAAMGEMTYGGAKGMKNFIMFTLGTGVGSGIVINGDLVYGHDGLAGEYGHTTLIAGGRPCGCGGIGHLEAYCSAPGMKRTAFELIAQKNASGSALANISFNQLSAKMIYEAAVAGDPIAIEVFEKTGKWLGQALADAVHHFSPEAIFLFGGPTAAGDLLFEPTRESMENYLVPVFRNKVKILPSMLKPGDAAITGASSMVWNEIRKKHPAQR